MAWQSGGGGGYPGVTSDGSNGLVVAQNFQAGNPNLADTANLAQFYGTVEIDSTPGSAVEGDTLLFMQQHANIPLGGRGVQAVWLRRTGAVNLADYTDPEFQVDDDTGSTQPAFQVNKQGTTSLEIGAVKSITGALSTVADAPAKAVLTSIIATLTGIKVATNNTT